MGACNDDVRGGPCVGVCQKDEWRKGEKEEKEGGEEVVGGEGGEGGRRRGERKGGEGKRRRIRDRRGGGSKKEGKREGGGRKAKEVCAHDCTCMELCIILNTESVKEFYCMKMFNHVSESSTSLLGESKGGGGEVWRA